MASEAKTLLAKMRFLEWASVHELPALQMRLCVMLTSLYSERRGAAWPSLEQITATLGASSFGVRKAIKALEEIGLIEVTRSRGRGHANEYRPCFDRIPEGSIYELKKGNPSCTFNEEEKSNLSCTFRAEEKCNSREEKCNSGRLKVQPQLPPSELVTSEEESTRSLARGATDVAPLSPRDRLQEIGQFLREAAERLDRGGLQDDDLRSLDRELDPLMDELYEAAGGELHSNDPAAKLYHAACGIKDGLWEALLDGAPEFPG